LEFEPKPSNDFQEFIETYYERCLAVCPQLRGIAGKWNFEDLIPGLSDFDARLVFEDGLVEKDWAAISINVGNVHTELAIQYPHWARKLEHNPGQNLTHAEMLDPILYNPESKLWTFYAGDEGISTSIRKYLQTKPWTRRDELFYLKKFAAYYGPYHRGIDPPVNMGRWENKYPLHSRFMHYFTPPVQAAVALAQKKPVRGKSDSLKTARRLFPVPEVIDMVLDAVERHYEITEYYRELRLGQIEAQLESYLCEVYAALWDRVTLIDVDSSDTAQELRAKVSAIPLDPVEEFCDCTRFGRLMRGRLDFYATDIPWFDTTWLIPNEVRRMPKNFIQRSLLTYGKVRWNEDLAPETVLARLEGNLLTSPICQGVRTFASLAGRELTKESQKRRAAELACTYEPIQCMFELLRKDLRRLTEEPEQFSRPAG
jgi:hypothetical protein